MPAAPGEGARSGGKAAGNTAGKAAGKATSEAGGVPIAATLPVARVALDLQPAHLDQPYDYLVPASMDEDAQPGVRIKARFGRQEVSGFVLARLAQSDHEGRLVPLKRVVSGERVLTAQVLELCRAVAARYGGTLADVLRLAVPPRHARVEQEAPVTPPGRHDDSTDDGSDDGETGDDDPGGSHSGSDGEADGEEPDVPAAEWFAGDWSTDPGGTGTSAWAPYQGGEAFLRRVLGGDAPRAVWSALPGVDDTRPAGDADTSGTDAPGPAGTPVPRWATAVAAAVTACVAGGRGALVVVPDARDVARVRAALDAAGIPAGPGGHVRLIADDGPAPRYRAYLAALRRHAPVVVGTRAAMFAPVRDLGLVVLWGDGEETLAEPHAPYPHARDVLAIRATQAGAAFLLGAPGRTVQAQALLATGWARELAPARDTLRAYTPRVRALTSVELARDGAAAAARLPSVAWRVAREALRHGPVLVQVPRGGYLPVVACARCRTAARCEACHGPLGLPRADASPQCTWCGRMAGGWSCPECGWTGLRSVRVGSARTAEELGRAFTGVPVRLSAASAPSGVVDTLPGAPALVVATPGAEPVARGGYTAVLLLDAAVMSGGTHLAAGTEALGRWLAAAALARPDGQVLLVGDGAPGPSQALVRWDPGGFAARELDERAALGLPPAVRVAAVTGDREAVAAVVERVGLMGENVLGPVEIDEPSPARRGGTGAPKGDRTAPAGAQDALDVARPVRTVLRVPLDQGDELARRLRASMAVRSARRERGIARTRMDPEEML
ncbi:primosomal protein N' [Myceligenerans sp. TRM 65318]|uniref:Probable replication restart protein PriA n=1 Tax=Myceligenerans pegani TaxID=2776917 RepID=A0ABR9MUB2_9MICO|nr:primosomal protein N' [Myceligenerans sp. TRM 65318]MBE3017239.1 primosomal protein N' [Myceligenerans sp. TRM 65318]